MKNEQNDLLKRAVLRRMGQLARIGESKRDAREAYNTECRTAAKVAGKPTPKWVQPPYIYGISTLMQYTDRAMKYAAWLAEVHPETRKLSYAHKKRYDREYVQLQIERGLSAWSINLTTAVLAKLHGCSMGAVHDARPARTRASIKRGRGYNETRYAEDCNKYGEVVELCRATGVRRAELVTLKPSDFRTDANGTLFLHLDGKLNNTKGGRSRDVEILECHQERVKAIVGEFGHNEVMCQYLSKRVNIHALRSLYAQDFYAAIATAPAVLKGKRITDPKGRDVSAVYHCRDGEGMPRRVYDRAALFRVSKSLGHNRCNVVATHYLK